MQELVTRKLIFGNDAQVIITVETEYRKSRIENVMLSFPDSPGTTHHREIFLPLRSSKGTDAILTLAKIHGAVELAIEWLDGSGLIEEK